VPMVNLPAVTSFRFAGAHGSGDGLGATAVLGEAAGVATIDGAADGAAEGAGVGDAAPEQAATSAPVSASAAAKRNGVRIVCRLSSMTGPARVYRSSRPRRGASPGRLLG
jgi:hypothetical protein